MNFSEVLTKIKEGHLAFRLNWNGMAATCYVELFEYTDADLYSPDYKDHLIIVTQSHERKTIYPWTPSSEDLLADDWSISIAPRNVTLTLYETEDEDKKEGPAENKDKVSTAQNKLHLFYIIRCSAKGNVVEILQETFVYKEDHRLYDLSNGLIRPRAAPREWMASLDFDEGRIKEFPHSWRTQLLSYINNPRLILECRWTNEFEKFKENKNDG